MNGHVTPCRERLRLSFLTLPLFLVFGFHFLEAQTDPLTIVCPPAISILCSDNPYDPDIVGEATASGGCNPDANFMYYEDSELVSGCSYILERIWIVLDECGSSATCSQIVTVIDDVPLTLTCPPDWTVSSCTSMTVPQQTGGVPIIHDNCSEPTYIWTDVTVGAVSCCDGYVIQRTWMAYDQCQTSATCVQIITVPGSSCDDGDPCTEDLCVDGNCTHVPVDCDDGDPCTTDYCDATGTCHHDAINCEDDGDPCTLDYCENGICVHVQMTCPQPEDACFYSVCVDGVCTTLPVNCDDGDPCTVDECVNGVCVHTPIDCSDGDPCTLDYCDGQGQCHHDPIVCDDDGDPCTLDYCENGVCVHVPIVCTPSDPCMVSVCVDGVCVESPMVCDDGDPCTIDECVNGVCVFTPINCDDNDPNTIDVCVDGQCIHTLISCDDGDPCTVDELINGECIHTPMDCDDGDPCTVDECINGVCTHTLINCDDNDPTTLDECIDGICVHTLIPCSDNDPCTIDAYVNGVCTHTPMNCDDGNPCTIDACVNGVCTHTPQNCDDGNPCTIDNCVNGVCTHTPMNCDDGNPCTTDNCVNGVCQHTAIPGCGAQPPVAVCDYSTYVFIDILHPDYNGPGINNIYLAPASNFDNGSEYSSPNPVMEVKRVGSLVSFEWTTNGACVDHTHNNIYNDPDKGKVYKTCLPVAPIDVFQWKSYKFRISDQYGSSECSGWYMVIPYLNFHKEGNDLNEYLTDDNLRMLQQAPPAQQAVEPDAGTLPVFEEGDFAFYPNPGDDEVSINWISADNEFIQVALRDITGKTILENKVWARPGRNKHIIDTHSLQPGSYILLFNSSGMFHSGIWIKAEK